MGFRQGTRRPSPGGGGVVRGPEDVVPGGVSRGPESGEGTTAEVPLDLVVGCESDGGRRKEFRPNLDIFLRGPTKKLEGVLDDPDW